MAIIFCEKNGCKCHYQIAFRSKTDQNMLIPNLPKQRLLAKWLFDLDKFSKVHHVKEYWKEYGEY